LRKLHEACCYEPSKPGKKTLEQFDEEDFNLEILRCMLRILGARKAEGAGDRLVRFLGLFLRVASEKGKQSKKEKTNA
jgi:condensin complex subunit 3